VKRNRSQFVRNSSNISFKSHNSYGERHRSKCLKCLLLGFEALVKTFLPLINRLINIALLVADHASIRCCFSS